MEALTLPGGALLGPEIAPMTANEEAAAKKRVAATLARLGHRPTSVPTHYPGKFSGIEGIAVLLRAAPPVVCSAWILDKEYTRIEFRPNGHTSMDSCGCCFTDHPPAWYLGKVREWYFVYAKCEDIYWTAICGPNGGPVGKTENWDILDSH
jgi:hypothetical protein